MIFVKLIGGLGNQMFQYATARACALRSGADLKLDISGYRHQIGITSRKYQLHVFNIRENFTGRFFIKPKIYREPPNLRFSPSVLFAQSNMYLDGYWQSERYFQDKGDQIRRDFLFKNPPDKLNKAYLSEITLKNSISVHIRRQDYVTDKVTHDFHGICDIKYYQKALLMLSKKVPKLHVYVFSDDPVWVKKNLTIKYPVKYLNINNGDKDWEDLRLMSACKHNVIANSSFSWWGAWLNKNPKKIVITPKRWFNNPDVDTTDRIPDGWIKI